MAFTGPMCEQVYKAELDGGNHVAVKIVDPAAIGTAAAHQRHMFEEEIQIMRKCNHPNVMGCLGYWLDLVSPVVQIDTDQIAVVRESCPCKQHLRDVCGCYLSPFAVVEHIQVF